MALEIVWESHGVYKRFWGFVTTAELIESVAKPRGDPRFDRIRYVIYDFLEVEGHEVTENAMAGVAAISSSGQAANPNVNVAILTTRDDIKQLAWLFASRTLASYPARAFSNPADAREWLRNRPLSNKLRPFMHLSKTLMEGGGKDGQDR
jgi:hypothetical protein